MTTFLLFFSNSKISYYFAPETTLQKIKVIFYETKLFSLSMKHLLRLKISKFCSIVLYIKNEWKWEFFKSKFQKSFKLPRDNFSPSETHQKWSQSRWKLKNRWLSRNFWKSWKMSCRIPKWILNKNLKFEVNFERPQNSEFYIYQQTVFARFLGICISSQKAVNPNYLIF